MEALQKRISEIHQLVSNPRSVISRDCLLDALQVLYTDCDKTIKKSLAVQQFVEKYKSMVNEIKTKSISSTDFDIIRYIEQGNFGNIYLVEEKCSSNVYVMKKMLREKVTNTVERDIMVESRCPYIVNLFYSFQDLNHVYFIMEYVTGGDFASLVENSECGYLSENKTRFYMHELVQAVRYLHDLGYVHRDIKPDNMLLSATGHLKLTDFGSATKVDRKGRIKSIVPVGTPEYVAPEVLEWMEGNLNNDGYTSSCDLWSIGVVAYELLTGNTPFNHETLDMTYSSILACDTEEVVQFPLNIKVSQEMIQLVQSLIQKFDTRINMNQVLSHPVFECLDSTPPCIPPPSNANKMQKKQKRRASPDIKSFKKEEKYLDTALPLVGISYTGESTVMSNNTMNMLDCGEEIRTLQREKLNLLQQLVESKKIIETYKKTSQGHKNLENQVLEKCKMMLDKNKSKCEEYERTIDDLKNVQDTLQTRVEQYQKENGVLSSEVTQLKSMMDARETRLRKEARKSQQFTEKQADSKIDELVVSWKNEMKLKDKKIDELKKLLETEQFTKQKLEENVAQDQQKLELMETQSQLIEKLSSELESCQHELKCTKIRTQSLETNVETLKKDLSSHLNINEKKNKEIEKLTHERNENDCQIVALKSEMDLLSRETIDKSEQLKEKEIELKDLNRRLNSLMIELKEKTVEQTSKTDDNKMETSELSKALEDVRSKLEDEKLLSKSARRDWWLAEKSVTSLKAELKITASKNETLQVKVDTLQKEITVSQEKCVSLQTALNEKILESDQMKSNLEIQKKQLDKYTEQINEVKTLKEKCDKDKKALQEVKSAKERLELEIRRYKTDFDSNKNDVEKYRNEAIELKAQVQKLSCETQSSKRENKMLDKQLEGNTKLVQTLREKEEKLTEENRKLKDEKTNMWHDLKTNEHKLKTLQTSYNDLKQNFNEKELKINTANSIINEYETKITNLENTITKSETYCKDVMDYMEKLKKNNDILVHDNEILRKERTEYITQLSNASSQNESLVKNNNNLINQISELEYTIKSLETFYKEKEIRLDTTVTQLMKLCEHQRMCYEQSLKKKPTLFGKVFGSNHNKEVESKEIESLLSQERIKANNLADQLYQAKAELNTLRRTTQRVAFNDDEDKENVNDDLKKKTKNKMTIPKEISMESIGSTISDTYKKALTKIMPFAEDTINTAIFMNEQCVILGTRDGLFSLHLDELGETKGKPNQIFGVDMVHSITFIHQKDIAIFISGPNRSLQKSSLRHLVTVADLQCSPSSLELTSLFDLTKVYLVSVSPCNNILAVASEGLLTIYRWNVVEFEELSRKELNGVVKCLNVISPHCVVFADEYKFYTFDPTTCRQRAWLNAREPVCTSNEARPLALLTIGKHEHLACFNTGALFVDDHGKCTRSDPLYWTYFPVSVVYRKPFLIVFNPNGITIIQISDHTLRKINSTSSMVSQPDDRVIDVRKPKYLGETLCNKNIVLMANSALQLLNPEDVFSAQSLTVSDPEELSLSAIDEELKLLEKHTSL